MKKLILCFLMLPLALNAGKLNLFIAGGPDFVQLTNNSYLRVSNQVINSYQIQAKNHWNGFWGGGISYSFLTGLSPTQFSLGLSGYSLSLGQVRGIEHPFVNAGVFDTLNYRLTINSSLLMIEPRFTYLGHNWQPFLMAGIGEAWNLLSNYQEAPTNPDLSAASPAFGFKDKTHSGFAYELGFGVQHRIFEDRMRKINYDASIGYRYFNFGRGQLSVFPDNQFSLTGLGIKNIKTQSIVFQIDASFN